LFVDKEYGAASHARKDPPIRMTRLSPSFRRLDYADPVTRLLLSNTCIQPLVGIIWKSAC